MKKPSRKYQKKKADKLWYNGVVRNEVVGKPVKKSGKRGHPFNDLSGMRFGYLLVEKRVYGKYIRPYFKCKCDCGRTTIICGTSLTRKNEFTRSCGCRKGVYNKLEKGEANFNMLYKGYKKRGTQRYTGFHLTKNKFKELTQSKCYYCGQLPAQVLNGNRKNGAYTYNGIDRLDSKYGYFEKNVVPCCGKCNLMKGSMGKEEFINQIKKIYENREKT